jgi:hypothetical protein
VERINAWTLVWSKSWTVVIITNPWSFACEVFSGRQSTSSGKRGRRHFGEAALVGRITPVDVIPSNIIHKIALSTQNHVSSEDFLKRTYTIQIVLDIFMSGVNPIPRLQIM